MEATVLYYTILYILYWGYMGFRVQVFQGGVQPRTSVNRGLGRFGLSGYKIRTVVVG